MKARKESWALFGLVALLWSQEMAWLHAQQAPAKETKHCLWQALGKSNTVYLLGSMHFLKKEFYPLAKPIEDAYQSSQIVIFEADLAEMLSPAIVMKMAQEGKYPEGDTLPKHVSEKTYAKLQSYLTEAVGSGAAFDSFKPWMVTVALAGIELQRLGFDPEQGVDMRFFQRAKQDRKETRGFETTEFQLSLFTELSKEEQEAMLEEALEDMAASRKILSEMTEAWRTGDTKALDKFMLETMRGYPQLHKKLLLDRNKRWVPTIETLLASDKNALVVVGTAHLIGKESVVDLLSKKGFKVEQK